jgi:centractin
MAYEPITTQPIVIDNGSGIIKAGFAGDDEPRVKISSYVGRPKYVKLMAGGVEGDVFIGPTAEEHRGLLSISYPVEHGIVNNWNDMEQIWTVSDCVTSYDVTVLLLVHLFEESTQRIS